MLLPFSVAGRAYELAAIALGQPELGLRVGGSTRLDRIPLGVILHSSPTLGAAFEALVRDGSRYNTGQRFWLVQRGEDVWLHRSFAPSLSRGRQQISDLVLAFQLALVRLAAGPGWRPAELRFEGPPPPHAERLAALAWRRVDFGCKRAGFSISRRLLALPLPAPDSLRERTKQGELPATEPRASLRQTVEALLRLGEPEISATAEAAGMSVRTLQRHLQRDGLRFADLVQVVRCRTASRLLRDSDLKVVEISAALGYTDSANFTRAFRRWMGSSPQSFRRAAAELPVGVSGVTSAAGSPASLPIG